MPRPSKIPASFPAEQYPISVALFEAVEMSETVQTRLRTDKKLAICLTISGEADTTREAAKIVGTTEGAMYNIRRGNSGKKYAAAARKMLLSGEGQRAIGRIIKIARQEKNIPQAMRANEWLAGVNGLSPAQRHEVEHLNAAPQVGMMVIHPDALSQDALAALIPVNAEVSGDSKSPHPQPQVIEHEGET